MSKKEKKKRPFKDDKKKHTGGSPTRRKRNTKADKRFNSNPHAPSVQQLMNK